MGDNNVREDKGFSLDDYKNDIPNWGTKKFKGNYIRMARDILNNHWGYYNLVAHNCQDYIDEILYIAKFIAQKNNDILEITE